MKIVTRLLPLILLIPSTLLHGQPARNCRADQRFVVAVERCVDKTAEDSIYLGVIDRASLNEAERTAILQDESKGQLTLFLTQPLIEAVQESPADSYEVEGYLMHGDNGDTMAVKSLRPIE